MKRIAFLNISLAAATTILVTGACRAQTSAEQSAAQAQQLPDDLSGSSYKTRPVPQVEDIAPFSANANSDQNPIYYRAQDEMTTPDRALVESANPSIHGGAAFAGMEFEKGSWSYRQLVCKAMPEHVFLIFEEDNGPGDVSMFSAAIPRSGKGRVRVIPIERRGYNLFSPAAVNALTIAAFNRIRADEPDNKSTNWLATGLCYAALAGARPLISQGSKDPNGRDFALVFPPRLELGTDGAITVRFVDAAMTSRPTEWAQTFDSKGQLLKVDHFAAPDYPVTPIPSK